MASMHGAVVESTHGAVVVSMHAGAVVVSTHGAVVVSTVVSMVQWWWQAAWCMVQCMVW